MRIKEAGHDIRFHRPLEKQNTVNLEMLARAASERLWSALVLLVVLAAASTRDLASVLRYSVAAGVNGYYYVLQIDHLTKSGQLYFSTRTPLVLHALAAFAHLTGNPITAIKIGSVLLHLLLSLGIFAIIQSTLRNPWLGVLGSALALIPKSHLYMTTEYINQLGALVLLVWAGWCAIRTVQTRRRIGLLILAALLVGAFFSHKSALIFAPTLASCFLLVLALTRSGICKPFAVLLTIILWLSPAIISAQRFFTIPEWLHLQGSFRPHWPFEPSVLAEGLMLAIAASTVLFFVVWLAPKTRRSGFNLAFGSIALWSLLVTLNPFFDAQAMLSGVAGRSRIFSYIQVALLVPGLVWLVSSMKREAAIYVGAVFIPLLTLSALAPTPYGLRPEFLTRRGELIQSLRIHSSEIAQNSIIVAPHGDQFVVTATIGIASQQRPPESSQYEKVYWLLNDVSDSVLSSRSITLLKNDHTATILVEDSVFKPRWEAMTIFDRGLLLRTNPHLAKILIHGGVVSE